MRPNLENSLPALSWHRRRRAPAPDLKLVKAFVQAELDGVAKLSRRKNGVLHTLPEVHFEIVGDRAIGRIHKDFLRDPSPTDVITFEHGDIVVSEETAIRAAAIHGTTVERELALYALHGLLHLAGFDDLHPRQARLMSAKQDEILSRWAGFGLHFADNRRSIP